MSTPGIPDRIRGSLDGIVDASVGGWAVDEGSPGSQVEVEVLVDGEVVGRALADRYRPDLVQAGIANGHCAFSVAIPLEQWQDGLPHELRARAAGTDLELDRSPVTIVLGRPVTDQRPGPFAADTVLHRRGSVDAVRAGVQRHGRVAVMAVHQPRGVVPSYLVAYLQALRDHGVAVVLVDTTDGGLAVDEDLAPLVLHRANTGWDFASWLAGIDAIRELLEDDGDGGARELLLLNDSVFGPLHPLQESWEHPRVADADFWGLTDSWAIAYHLQSYFLVLRRAAFTHPAFWAFLERYPFPQAKRQVVRDGEIGLSAALHAAGLRSAVTCPYDAVARAWLDGLPERLQRIKAYPENAFLDTRELDRAVHSFSAAQSLRSTLEAAHHIRRGLPLNGGHLFWDTLVEDFRLPFVKRELLQANPAEIPYATELTRVLGATGYDVAHVRDAARRGRGWRVATI